MEGNSSPDSPVLVFINDNFTNLHIWDPTIAIFKERCPEYRLLRYDMRGYSTESIGMSDSITLALLVSDLEFLLERLSLSHVNAIIGLGFGANIGLALLADRPSISSTFVGIGFAIPDSAIIPRETAVDDWALRSSLARRVGMGITADKACARWFTADARGSPEWVRVRQMIAAGSIEGMEKLSNAVLEGVGHDTEQRGQKMLESLEVPTLFLCGSSDAALPEEMETYPAMMRKEKGAFRLIPRASRLACCENPTEFVNILENWLDGFL
ncbi:alpha/beta-hydrolase [Acephala macrosclerotiorum]|nr:alpha/beta-hydrolase [Acephala macrosclerotiorum]